MERHFRTLHKNYDRDFPARSKLRRTNVNELQSQLIGQQSLFTRPGLKAKAATEASVTPSLNIKKSLKDGQMIKVAFMEAAGFRIVSGF